MAMTRKTITITNQMDDWVKGQVESGKYGNDSEYFRDLIRKDQSKKDNLETLRNYWLRVNKVVQAISA